MANVAIYGNTLNYNIWVMGYVNGIVVANLSFGGNSNEKFIFEPSGGSRKRTYSFEIQFDGTTGHGAQGDIINLIPTKWFMVEY